MRKKFFLSPYDRQWYNIDLYVENDYGQKHLKYRITEENLKKILTPQEKELLRDRELLWIVVDEFSLSPLTSMTF